MKASTVQFSHILKSKSPKSIFATLLELPLRLNKSVSRFQCMPCQELTSLLAHKITATCGSTKVRLRDSLYSSHQLKLDIERWEDRSVGLLTINLTPIKYMISINSIILNSLRISSVQSQLLSKCSLLEDRAEFSEDSLYLILPKSPNCSGNLCLWSLESIVTVQDWD